jgi:phosphoribulokinase
LRRNNKINNPLVKLTIRNRDSIQVSKIRNEKRDITIETEEIQKIIRSYSKSLYSTKLENLNEMKDFLDRYKIPKLNKDRVNYQKHPIIAMEINLSLKNPNSKKPRARLF